MINRPFLICSLIMILIISSGWGFFAHKTINQLAVYALPAKLQQFYYSNHEYIIKHSVRPDLRRNDVKEEAVKHFIDLDVYGEDVLTNFPETYEIAVAKFSEDTIQKYGTLPWVIYENYDKLIEAFKLRNADSILFYSADLAHYIGDAHVPLHTTLNYDGQLTNQHGIHSLWESKVPEMFYQEFTYTFSEATYIKNPLTTAWKFIRESYKLNKDLFDTETKVAEKFTGRKYDIVDRDGEKKYYYTKDFTLLYGQEVNQIVNHQLLKAAKSTADFWYSAWVDAGKPDLKFLTKNFDRASFDKEYDAWKKDELVKQEFLKSLKRY